MPLRQSTVHFPTMALTLVRRVTAKLPPNHFLFRTEPRWTKTEITEYLRAVYGVRVADITTSISQGKIRRAPGKRNLLFRLKTYKRVYVRTAAEDAPAAKAVAAPQPAATASGLGDRIAGLFSRRRGATTAASGAAATAAAAAEVVATSPLT